MEGGEAMAIANKTIENLTTTIVDLYELLNTTWSKFLHLSNHYVEGGTSRLVNKVNKKIKNLHQVFLRLKGTSAKSQATQEVP